MSPWLIGLTLFFVVPLVVSLVMSFTDYELVDQDDTPTRFVGLENWRRLFERPRGVARRMGHLRFALIFIPMSICPAARSSPTC